MSNNLSDFEKMALEISGVQSNPEPSNDVINDDDSVTENTVQEDVLEVQEDVNLEEPSQKIESPDEPETATPTSEDETDSDGDMLLEEDINLDDYSTEEPEAVESSFDFSKLSNDLGFEVKGKDDLVSRFKELNEQLKSKEAELESASSSIPEDLKGAIKLAKDGGDYLEYLKISSVDYNNIDEVELFEYEVSQLFTDSKGNVDTEGLEEYLDSLSDVDKKLKGRELKSQYVQKQQATIAQLERQAAEKKATADKALKQAVDSMNNVAGFKVNPSQKSKLFNDISTGKMVSSLFYDKNGNYDFNKIAENYFKILNFDKIQNFYKQRVKANTKKEILNETTNSNVTAKQELANPGSNTRSQSPLDSYLAALKGNK